MSELLQYDAATIAARVAAGDLRARAVTDAYLERIHAHDGTLRAFVQVDAEAARSAADGIDQRVAKGQPVGALAGVPVAVKDNLCVAGQPTTCSSAMLRDFKPPYTAHVVESLCAADAIPIGKTNLDEFAMGSSTENSALQVTRNPWNLERVPGGSSGGSAAAVAAGMAPLALGSDTGGSIRLPASFCGVVGMKPTYGAVSRYGLVAFGSSLDQIGPFARSVADTALFLSVIAGPDGRDSTCRQRPMAELSEPLQAEAKGLRIGVPKEYFETEGMDPAVRDAVMNALKALEGEGATLVDVSLSMVEYAVPTYYVIATAEASSNLARYDGIHYGHRSGEAEDLIDLFARSREEGFGDEVKRRIMLGSYVLSAGYGDKFYLSALKVRTRIAQDFDAAFANCDIIAAPVCANTAFPIGAKVDDPLAMYLTDVYTISVNLAALPALSLPCGQDGQGLPVGLQLIAPRWADKRLLDAAAAAEAAIGHGAPLAPLA